MNKQKKNRKTDKQRDEKHTETCVRERGREMERGSDGA